MMSKEKKKAKISKAIIYAFLVLMAIIYIVALMWVFLVSFKTNSEIFTNPFGLPESFYLDNFTFALTARRHIWIILVKPERLIILLI